MSAEIIVALIGMVGMTISSLLTYKGVISSNKKANNDMIQKLEAEQQVYKAVMDEKTSHINKRIEELRREVEKYNNVKLRTYELEKQQALSVEKIASLANKVSVIEGKL